MNSGRRLKILVSAYACSPFKGSEPGVGWGVVTALARNHELWVIVEQEKFQKDIERMAAAEPELCRNLHFFYVRKKRNRLLRRIWPPSYYWYYRRWHRDAFRLAAALHQRVNFDLAHQLTMVGFREPGYLWQLGIPFVWGPVGGMGLFPWRFLPVVGLYGFLYYLGYNLFNVLQMHFLPRPRSAARAAGGGLMAATPENQAGALRYWGVSSTVVCEVGLSDDFPVQARPREAGEKLRLVWSGQHLERKALNLGLQALAQVPADIECEVHILGRGPKTAAWQALAGRLGIGHRCRFHGWLARNEALTVMGEAHVMLITSLRDLTSTVTVEALALGLPIICLDHCGFAHVVDGRCGIKVPVTSPGQVVRGLAAAIELLARDEGLRWTLAEGALLRAGDFTWKRNAEAVNRIYGERLRRAEAVLDAGGRG